MLQKEKSILSSELFAVIEPMLQEGKQAAFYVSGMSMWPFICHKRDSVVVAAPRNHEFQIGDIVLFQVPEVRKYILHRITHLDADNQKFQSTGDGNCFRDGWFSFDTIVAVVTAINYKGKQISVEDARYRRLSGLWRSLYPIRPILLRILRRISKMKS